MHHPQPSTPPKKTCHIAFSLSFCKTTPKPQCLEDYSSFLYKWLPFWGDFRSFVGKGFYRGPISPPVTSRLWWPFESLLPGCVGWPGSTITFRYKDHGFHGQSPTKYGDFGNHLSKLVQTYCCYFILFIFEVIFPVPRSSGEYFIHVSLENEEFSPS